MLIGKAPPQPRTAVSAGLGAGSLVGGAVHPLAAKPCALAVASLPRAARGTRVSATGEDSMRTSSHDGRFIAPQGWLHRGDFAPRIRVLATLLDQADLAIIDATAGNARSRCTALRPSSSPCLSTTGAEQRYLSIVTKVRVL